MTEDVTLTQSEIDALLRDFEDLEDRARSGTFRPRKIRVGRSVPGMIALTAVFMAAFAGDLMLDPFSRRASIRCWRGFTAAARRIDEWVMH